MSGEVTAIMGISTKVLISGAVGGAVSMVLGGGKWWEKATRGLVGATCAYIGHHVMAKILVGILDMPFDAPNLPTVEEMEPVAAFLIGLVGMVLCQMAINAAKAAKKSAPEFILDKLDPDHG